MHLPTATLRASGTLATASIVARDYVRALSDFELLKFEIRFLEYEEAEVLAQAIELVPEQERVSRFSLNLGRTDEQMMVAIALHAKEPETLQALADSQYVKAICVNLIGAGHGALADAIKMRRIGSPTAQTALPANARPSTYEATFGTPLRN